MKLSIEGEKYADTLFFNQSRIIYEDAKLQLLNHKFVGFEDTAQKDYSLQQEVATKMAAARMDSYVTAYEAEGEIIEQDDVIEFIKRSKDIIDRQSRMILSGSGGTITMVRNQWSDDYREQMLTLFREKAFSDLEPKMNELILRSKEAPLKLAVRKKMGKRNELFRWIYEQCEGRQYRSAHLRNLLQAESDWNEKELVSASDYLAGEGLIEQKDDSGLMVWLTHNGVKVGSSPADIVEGAENAPIFQNTQNINNFHAPVGAIQQGNNNVANVAQKFGSDLDEIGELLKKLRQHIEPESQDSGHDYIDALEEEITKEEPKESRIKLFLNGLNSVATETGKALIVEIGKKILLGEIRL